MPQWLLKGENAEDHHDPRDLFGAPTPFAMTLAATVLTSATPAREMVGIGQSAHLQSTPLVFLVLVLLFLAITVMSVVRVLDRQRMLGIMKSIGFAVSDLRTQNRVAGISDVLAGTGLGILAFAGLGERLMQVAGASFTVTWSMAVGWIAVMAVVVWWQGAVVTILFHHTDIRSLLLRSGRFDWWALLRFDLTKPVA